MPKLLQLLKPPGHRLVSCSALLGFCFFLLFSPVFGTPTTDKPQVKAAFTDRVTTPVTHSLTFPTIGATSILITDLDTNTPLFERSIHDRLAPASVTKIMTALVSLDYYPEGSIIHVKDGARALGNTAKLVYGDDLLVEDVLYALLVPSGNDAAVVLAENYPGGYPAFINAMNAKAIQLGLTDTHFANVSGVEGPNHYTTTYDLTQIAKEVLKRPILRRIISTQKVTLKSVKGYYYPLLSTNVLLSEPGVLGMKTGWTPQAGECLITYVVREDHPILIVLLNSTDRFGDTKKILNWIFKNFSWE